MKTKQLLLAFLSVFLTFHVTSSPKDSKQLYIVTSVKYLNDLTQNVTCGDSSVTVDVLIPEGSNPHTFHLDAKSKRSISDAQLLLLVHPELEGWSTKLNDSNKFYLGKHLPLEESSTSQSCPHAHNNKPQHYGEKSKETKKHHDHNDHHHHGHDHDHHHHNYDIHIWHSLDLTEKSLNIILKELISRQPEKKLKYTQCAQNSASKIRTIKDKLKQSLSLIPKEKRVIAIPHNSLNYLAKEFDIQIVPIFLSNHFNIAHPNELVKIINSIKKKKIQALFYEDVSPKKTVDLISKEAKLKIGGTLATDSYSSLHNINDYIELWTYNIDTIKKALK